MQMYSPIDSNDLARYRELRARAMQISSKMIHTIPRQAMSDIAKTLGIARKGVLVFDSMDTTSVLMDACLFDWLRDGKNLAEKYFEANPAPPEASEHILQYAFTHARYRILFLEDFDQSGPVYCLDILSNERLTLMDIGLSQTLALGAKPMLATRTVPLGDYWMTTGAALPVGTRATGQTILQKIRGEHLLEDKTPEGEHRLALAVTRACLDCGAGETIRYRAVDGSEDDQKELEQEVAIAARRTTVPAATRHVARNAPCPCGSGKKFKRCCLRRA